jgi:hypothetical protein
MGKQGEGCGEKTNLDIEVFPERGRAVGNLPLKPMLVAITEERSELAAAHQQNIHIN